MRLERALLADDWLPVTAPDVVEGDAVVVDSVQDSQAGLSSLTVVRLFPSKSAKNTHLVFIFSYTVVLHYSCCCLQISPKFAHLRILDLPSGCGPVTDLVKTLADIVGPTDLAAAVVDISASPEVGGGGSAQHTNEVVSLGTAKRNK